MKAFRAVFSLLILLIFSVLTQAETIIHVSNIEIGFDNKGNYGRVPKNCKIINNLIVSSTNPIVKSFSSTSLAGVSFESNLMHATIHFYDATGVLFKQKTVQLQDGVA